MSKYYTCQLYNYTEYTVVLIIVCYLSTLTNTALCQYPCIKTENECGCVFKNAKNEPMLISLSDLDYKSGTAYL